MMVEKLHPWIRSLACSIRSKIRLLQNHRESHGPQCNHQQPNSTSNALLRAIGLQTRRTRRGASAIAAAPGGADVDDGDASDGADLAVGEGGGAADCGGDLGVRFGGCGCGAGGGGG